MKVGETLTETWTKRQSREIYTENDINIRNIVRLRDTNEDKIQCSANVLFCKISDSHGGLADNNSKCSLLT